MLNTPGDLTLFAKFHPDGVDSSHSLPFPAVLRRVSDPSLPYGYTFRYVPAEQHEYAVKATALPGLCLFTRKPLPRLLVAKAYKLEGRCKWHGLDISIENGKGSVRRGVDPDGHAWSTRMLYPYGYLRNTQGTDGDHLDCYVGPDEDAAKVYIVHQVDPTTGGFDEDKVMLGFPSADAAKRAYLAHYDTPKFFGGMTEMHAAEFAQLVKSGKLTGKVVMGEPRARAGKAELKRLLEVAKRQRTVTGGLSYYVKRSQ